VPIQYHSPFHYFIGFVEDFGVPLPKKKKKIPKENRTKFSHVCSILDLNADVRYVIILVLNWLPQLGSVRIRWAHKWLQFVKVKHVRLQVHADNAIINMWEGIELSKESKTVGANYTHQLYWCTVEKATREEKVLWKLRDIVSVCSTKVSKGKIYEDAMVPLLVRK
jgi:hypothetical protein